MSHVKLWCLKLLFIPGGQVRPCYSLVNTITAIQAVWLSASSSLLPFCPHRGQLSQPQCSTWGTQRHSPITASEGLAGNHAMSQKGAYTYLGTGEAVPSSAHTSMPFHLMVSSGFVLVFFSSSCVCPEDSNNTNHFDHCPSGARGGGARKTTSPLHWPADPAPAA